MKRWNLMLALLLLINCSVGAEKKLPSVGDTAPDFKVKTIDGREFDTKKLRGKVVVVNFFAIWCPACRAELPHLQKEVAALNSKDLEVLVLGREHSEKELSDFAQKQKLTLPLAADPKRGVYSLYTEKIIPQTYIIDRQGKIVYHGVDYTPEKFQPLVDKLKATLKSK